MNLSGAGVPACRSGAGVPAYRSGAGVLACRPGSPATIAAPRARHATAWLASVPWFCAVLPGLPFNLDAVVRVGPISLNGAVAIAQLLLFGLAVLGLRSYPLALLPRLVPLVGFLGWAVARSSFGVSFAGVQNLTVYLMFGAVAITTAALAERHPAQAVAAVRRGVLWLDWIVPASLALVFLTHGFPLEPDSWPISPRAIAITALFPLAWHLSAWRTGTATNGIVALLWYAAIAVTMSRTALGVAIVLGLVVLMGRLRHYPRRVVGTLGPILALLVVALSAGSFTAALEERFFTGDTSIEVGGMAMNASGRMDIWEAVAASGMQHPILGGGLGSGQDAVAEFGEYVNHPHNDYLRLWHDLGIPGIVFFAWLLVDWLVVLARARRRARRAGLPEEKLLLTAVLSLFAFAAVAGTDNPVVYSFVMGPLAVLVGTGLGIRSHLLERR